MSGIHFQSPEFNAGRVLSLLLGLVQRLTGKTQLSTNKRKERCSGSYRQAVGNDFHLRKGNRSTCWETHDSIFNLMLFPQVKEVSTNAASIASICVYTSFPSSISFLLEKK